jgi:hypothetical protein
LVRRQALDDLLKLAEQHVPPPVEEAGPQVVVLAKQAGVGQVHLRHGVKANSHFGEDRLTQAQWRGWLAALAATLVTAGLVAAEIDDVGMRHWWSGHALTTDTVSGLLVLLITLLVVNQVVRRRQLRDRSQAVAAQAAIMMAQADRASKAVSAVLDGSGDRNSAADEFRTYMMMLLVGAPVLIDGRLSRAFLEQAQRLGGEMARVLATMARAHRSEHAPTAPDARLNQATARLRSVAAPLLQPLDLSELVAAGVDDAGNQPSSEQSS